MKKSTKRVVSSLLSATLVASSVFCCTFASADNSDKLSGGTDGTTWVDQEGNDATAGKGLPVTLTTTAKDRYAIALDWGDMHLRYDFGDWDNGTSSYKDGGWSVYSFDGTNNKVKATLESPVVGASAVNVTMTFKEYDDTPQAVKDLNLAMYKDNSGTNSTDGVAQTITNVGDSVTEYLWTSQKPDDSLADTLYNKYGIGEIVVKVEKQA